MAIRVIGQQSTTLVVVDEHGKDDMETKDGRKVTVRRNGTVEVGIHIVGVVRHEPGMAPFEWTAMDRANSIVISRRLRKADAVADIVDHWQILLRGES